MKTANGLLREKILLITALTLILISTPALLFGQNKVNQRDFDIVVTCTEYIGDGKMRAHFGYENREKKTR